MDCEETGALCVTGHGVTEHHCAWSLRRLALRAGSETRKNTPRVAVHPGSVRGDSEEDEVSTMVVGG